MLLGCCLEHNWFVAYMSKLTTTPNLLGSHFYQCRSAWFDLQGHQQHCSRLLCSANANGRGVLSASHIIHRVVLTRAFHVECCPFENQGCNFEP